MEIQSFGSDRKHDGVAWCNLDSWSLSLTKQLRIDWADLNCVSKKELWSSLEKEGWSRSVNWSDQVLILISEAEPIKIDFFERLEWEEAGKENRREGEWE
jgi:hypothetical protein